MKRFKIKWKTVITWTLLVHVVVLIVALHSRITRNLEDVEGSETVAVPTPTPRPRPTRMPDEDLAGEDIEGMMAEAIQTWSEREPAQSMTALMRRSEDLNRIPPDHLEGIAEHLAKRSGVEVGEVREVPLEELDIDHAAPVNMWFGANESGRPGVWMRLRDRNDRESVFWVPEEDLSSEEIRAARAFELIGQVPGFEALRPIFFQHLLQN